MARSLLFTLALLAAAAQPARAFCVPSPASPLQTWLRPQRDAHARCAASVLSLAALAEPPQRSSSENIAKHAAVSTVRRASCAAAALFLLPLSAAASDGDEDKRILYTVAYTVAHLPVVIPFLLFWKVDKVAHAPYCRRGR